MNNVQEHEALLLQRLRDLENKVVIENSIPDISVPQSIKTQRSEAYSTTEKDFEAQNTAQNTSPLDVTKLPILEEYY